MNTQELIELIDKIGMMKGPYFRDLELSTDDIVTGVDELQQFAAAIRAAAFDECAEICEKAKQWQSLQGSPTGLMAVACVKVQIEIEK